jgi:hypothetical protein
MYWAHGPEARYKLKQFSAPGPRSSIRAKVPQPKAALLCLYFRRDLVRHGIQADQKFRQQAQLVREVKLRHRSERRKKSRSIGTTCDDDAEESHGLAKMKCGHILSSTSFRIAKVFRNVNH